MAWSTGLSDLRTALSDGPTDRYSYRKQIFGQINGTNTTFKTFEDRRVTDFTLTQGIYKNGNLLTVDQISSDNTVTGEFVLLSAPVDGDLIEASYYTQWFIDSELTYFLTQATRWLGLGTDYTQIADGLIPAAEKFAQAEAYLKMAQKWRNMLSQVYRVEDAPSKTGTTPVDSYIKMAEDFRKQAQMDRDEYYTRQGQQKQPLFSNVLGSIRQVP